MKDVLLKIIEEFSDGFLIVNREGRILFFNDVLLKTTGLHSTDILTREKEFLENLGLLDENAPCEREAVIEDRAGTPQRFNVSSLDVEAEGGSYVLARISAAGASDGTRLRRQLETLFRNIGDPIISADLSGRITLANPSFY